MSIREAVARAVYHAAFENQRGGKLPEPGWCWEKCGSVQQEFASRQAAAAITAFLQAAAIPDQDGRTWHIRPDEPTDAMRKIGDVAWMEEKPASYIYRAMCEAAPTYELDP